MARDGIADVAHVNPGYEPGRFPVMGAMELPFLFANAKAGSAALDAWYRKYAAKEMADVHYCLTFAHDPGTFHSTKKKIVVPGDVKGMKVRPANATIARFISLLGGTNVQASAPEARDVLEKGVAEAITFPWGSIVLFGIDKVTKYHVDSAFYVTEQGWVINKGKYEALSAGQKKVIDDHCTPEWSEKIAVPWADFEAGGRDKIKAQGHELNALTPEQLAEWRKAAEPLYAEWAENAKKAGYDPDCDHEGPEGQPGEVQFAVLKLSHAPLSLSPLCGERVARREASSRVRGIPNIASSPSPARFARDPLPA